MAQSIPLEHPPAADPAEEELDYRDAVERHAIIAVTNRRGVITYVNELFCRISGYTRDELIGRTHQIINSGHHSREFWRNMWSTIASRSIWRGEVCNRARDGTLYWVDSTIVPLVKNGTLHGYIAIRHPITALKQARAENEVLERREAFREAVLDAVSYAIIATSEEGVINVFNRGAEQLLGYRAAEVVEKRTIAELSDPAELAARSERIAALRAAAAGERYDCEWTFITKSGARVPMAMSLAAMRSEHGEFVGYLGVAHDISQHKQTQRELHESELKFRSLYQAAPVGIVRSDQRSGRLLESNPAFQELTGFAAQELTSLALSDVILRGPGDEDRSADPGAPPDEARGPVERECIRRDGTRRQVLLNRVPDGRGSIWSIAQDITSRKEMEQALLRAAHVDALTGLANRRLFCAELKRVIHAAARLPKRQFALLYLDLDDFKHINDSLGHEAGDEMLRQIATRLRDCFGADTGHGHGTHCTIARFGGDEFVVLLHKVRSTAEVTAAAERLVTVLSRPYQLLDREFHRSVSIGIVASDGGQRTPEEYLRDADTAMYEAKAAGRGRFVSFNRRMRQRVHRRLILENDLHRALRSQQLYLAYQPIVRLAGDSLCACEALLRWQHPQLGAIAPTEFISIAEESGLILELGDWVLDAACARFADWRARLGELAPETLSVNISRAQLILDDFADRVATILERNKIPPDRLCLEITETAMMLDAETAMKTLRVLHDLGVQLSLDDFGTGYSSLSTIHLFPIDGIKIDRAFVQRVAHGRGVAALMEAVVHLGDSLGMEVTAEGIETPEQLTLVKQIGCLRGQGYWFAPPLGAQDFEELLVTSQRPTAPYRNLARADGCPSSF
ncbi:MAG TPA: EAL domain-containing protein [Steroidobacteraceae bacterium]|nr:EAL domain-containing protein [Steroidobacteraceae bacterium]